MPDRHYEILLFVNVKVFLENIEISDRAKLLAHIQTMQSRNFTGLSVKTLKSPIRELRVKKYRLMFFIRNNIIYLIEAFVKKQRKHQNKK